MIKAREAIANLKPYIPGRPIEDVKREFRLETVHKLASNENPYGCSSKARRAIIDSALKGELYLDGHCSLLRVAVSKHLGIAENQLVFGAGTDEVIAMISKVFVNEGDECITAETTFSQYFASVKPMNGIMKYAPMKDYGFDLDKIIELITPKTKAIFIANPNNPTGTMHTNKQQLDFIAKVPKDVLIVIDEAYAEFVDSPDYPQTLEHMKEHKNVMLLKTFSKVYGLAALRVGYGVAAPEIIEEFEKIRCPFNVSVAGQSAATAAIGDQEFVDETKINNLAVKELMYKAFKDMGLFYIPTHANFVMVDVKRDSTEVFTALMKKGYIIRPGAAFGMDSFIRITLGTIGQMMGFIIALKEVLGE